jgi:hypothetical protein
MEIKIMLATIYASMLRFDDQTPAVGAVGREKRRYHRLYTNLAIEYRVSLQRQAGSISNRATMKNISKGGAYLECYTKPDLNLGQVGYFTFRPLDPGPDQSWEGVHLAARAVVRRLEGEPEGAYPFGVAVEFLSGPLITYQQ